MLFQPKYLIWPVAFTALLPLAGLEPRRLCLMGGLFAGPRNRTDRFSLPLHGIPGDLL
jgi:hypothetical protein